MISKIKKLRKYLHQNPELSGNEINTAKRIKVFVKTYHNTKIIENIGGNGLAVIYEYEKEGPSIMIRCELDALQIEEKNTFNYKSIANGVSHKCGHDGHMAIVAGLIFWIKEQSFKSGKIILLFQSAEETGRGAYDVLNDEKFKSLNPDFIFALHNIPGEPLNSIIRLKKKFSSTVQSMIVHLTGKESHASEPENGINPASGVSEIINKLSKLNNYDTKSENFSILTPIHINMGQKSYGISPGIAELHYTLRTWTESEMKKLKERLNRILIVICNSHKLELNIDWLDYFPATQNDNTCNKIVENAANLNGYELQERQVPFRFGEDFGWFSHNRRVSLFGLGAGLDSPALHHADYDFPEELIETGMNMFKEIIKQVIE